MDINTPDPAVMQLAIDLACRAPSLHNSQPWRWRYEDGRVELHADRSRMLPAADPTGRQVQLSCGAALDHFRICLIGLGWRTETRLESRASVPSLVATVSFRHDAHPQSHDFDLLTAISHRRTDRRSFGPLPRGDDLVARCARIAGRSEVGLVALGWDAREEIGAAVEVTAAARKYDAGYQAELHWWAGHGMRTGGIPESSLVSDTTGAVPLGREFPVRQRAGASAGPEADESTILVLGTLSDKPSDWLRCGQVLSTVLLEATVAGVATCPLSHLTEIPLSRSMIQRSTPAAGVPQIMVRVGRAPNGEPPVMTARRPVADVYVQS